MTVASYGTEQAEHDRNRAFHHDPDPHVGNRGIPRDISARSGQE